MPVAFPTGTELPGKPKEHVRRVELDQRDIANDVLIHTLTRAKRPKSSKASHGHRTVPMSWPSMPRLCKSLTYATWSAAQPARSQSIKRRCCSTAILVIWQIPTSHLHQRMSTTNGTARHVSTSHAGVRSTSAGLQLRHHTLQRHPLRPSCTSTAHYPRPPLAAGQDPLHAGAENRQPEGADVDLDAVVDRYATVRSGSQPDDRLYLARRRHTRDLVTLLLVDLSSSTDAWIQGYRVLDIAKESVLVLTEVLAQWRDQVGIPGFTATPARLPLCAAEVF